MDTRITIKIPNTGEGLNFAPYNSKPQRFFPCWDQFKKALIRKTFFFGKSIFFEKTKTVRFSLRKEVFQALISRKS